MNGRLAWLGEALLRPWGAPGHLRRVLCATALMAALGTAAPCHEARPAAPCTSIVRQVTGDVDFGEVVRVLATLAGFERFGKWVSEALDRSICLAKELH